MSSIIDALKKSDQSRNSDNKNTLNNINFSEQPPAKSRRGFWVLIILLLLIALATYGWQQGWHHSLMDRFTAQAPETTDEQNTQVNDSNGTPPVTQTAEPASQAGKLTPPKQAEVKAQSQQLTQKPPAQMIKATPQNPSEDVNSDSTQPNSLTVVENRTKSNSEPAEMTGQPGKGQQPVADTPAQDDTPKRTQPELKQDHLYLHQLSFAVRKNIPDVKISIHIYDPDPEKRMLMINGEKIAIGDSIDGLLTVEDIVPEGVVLTYENIRFLLPK